MAISRGFVCHTLLENIYDFLRVIINPNLLKSASDKEKSALIKHIGNYFENSYVELFPYARTCLHASLLALRLPRNSKILMTPITIGPMVEVIRSLGHEVVYVDIETKTFGPDLIDLKNKIKSERPACILLTHLFGYISQLDKVVEICKEHNIFMIEDISHSIGALFNNHQVGLWGDIAIYSSSLLKCVDSYNGAFTLTKNKNFYAELHHYSKNLSPTNSQRIRKIILKTFIWNLSLSHYVFSIFTWPILKLLKTIRRDAFERILGPGIAYQYAPNLPSYYFEKISSIQAEVMLRNFKNLSFWLNKKLSSAKLVSESFEMVCADLDKTSTLNNIGNLDSGKVYWQYLVRVRSVTQSREILFKHGIETNTTNLRDLAFDDGIDLPGSRELKNEFIFIPLHPHLSHYDYCKIFNLLKKSNQLIKL